MPLFSYEALDSRGRPVQGQMEATTSEVVIRELRSVNYTVVKVEEKKDYVGMLNEAIISIQGVSLYVLAIFTRQFATIFNSGIPILRGLEGLSSQTLNKKLRQVLAEVHSDIMGGFSLTRALQKHPNVFSPVYIALIRAGEMSGSLGVILERLAVLLEKEYGLKQKVQSSMIYPAFVFGISVIITFFIVNYIFPSFISLLEGLDMALPWPTMLLVFISGACKNVFVLSLFAVIITVSIIVFKQYFTTPIGKRQLHKFLLEVPVVGNLNRKVAIARFCRTLGTLLESGVPMLHSLEMVGKVSGNEIIADIMEEVKMSLKSGMRFSQPMKAYPLFPPMVTQMIAVGEETGNLPPMLDKMANFYDSEVEMALEAFVSLIEPFMILFLGIIVTFVMVAVFLPIYGVFQKF